MKITGVSLLRPFKIEGIVLYPFILFASKNPDDQLINHEAIHVQQIKRDGVFNFYTRYLWEYFSSRRKGLTHDQAYRTISYEKEAYEHHHELAYRVAARLT